MARDELPGGRLRGQGEACHRRVAQPALRMLMTAGTVGTGPQGGRSRLPLAVAKYSHEVSRVLLSQRLEGGLGHGPLGSGVGSLGLRRANVVRKTSAEKRSGQRESGAGGRGEGLYFK